MTRIQKDFQSYKPLGIICIDLDGLKKINDAYSHKTGDSLLKHVALILNAPSHTDKILFPGSEGMSSVLSLYIN